MLDSICFKTCSAVFPVNIKQNTDPTDQPIIQKKLSRGEIVIATPSTLGQYSAQFSPADSNLLNQLRAYWIDSQITDPTGTFTVVSTDLEIDYILTKE